MSEFVKSRLGLFGLLFISILINYTTIDCTFISTSYSDLEPVRNYRTTVIDFFYKENFWGKPKHVILRKDKCMNVPTNYFFKKPQSVWASDCIVVFNQDFCWGEGHRIAGLVPQLRYAGLYDGISSVRPCESNIRIQFKG